MHIPLVEDNKRMAGYLKRALSEEGYVADVVHDGDEGMSRAARGSYDAVVLDVRLPEPLRPRDPRGDPARQDDAGPVIALGAHVGPGQGPDQGADDYLAPPSRSRSSARCARCSAAANQPATVLTCADLRMDLLERKVSRGKQAIALTAKEFSFLEYLLRNQGRALPRTSIAEHVWGYTFDWQSNIIEVFINQLRLKIDMDFEPKLIHTVRGVGYKMQADG